MLVDALVVVGEDLDDAAVGDGAVVMAFEHAGELAAKAGQTLYPFIDLGETLANNLIEIGAGRLLVAGDAEHGFE